MRTRAVFFVALVATFISAVPADAARRSARLRVFSSCNELVGYANHHATRTMRVNFDAPRSAPAPTGPPQAQQAPAAPGSAFQEDTSTTNVQEAGVDEPDIVKTDGRRIFALAGDSLHAIEAREGTPRKLGSLRVPGLGGGELLLHRGRLLVISNPYGGFGPSPGPMPAARSASPPILPPSNVVLTEIEVSDPAAMKVLRTLTVEGRYISARERGGTARVVIASRAQAMDEPDTRTKPEGWVPTGTLKTASTNASTEKTLVRCRAVRRPASFGGVDMLTVLTIDMRRGLPAVDSDALMTSAEHVYASADSLYVATERWLDSQDAPQPRARPSSRSAIHRFSIADPEHTIYRASGEVPGYLLNQFSMSEHRGVLRVASTERPQWAGGDAPERDSESFVSVLDQREGRLETVGRVGGLGRGERIYSVRFIEDVGYVVTFRQVDPLYTIDLSRPGNPRVLGELKILGYSAYLHPVGEDLLLGIGQDAGEDGVRRGAQLSLFDVSDLRNPRRLAQRTFGSASMSEVEYDHHAFLYWPARRLAVLPVSSYGSPEFTGALGFRLTRASGIDDVGRVSHPGTAQVRRSLVVANRLFTVSEMGVRASQLADLDNVAWVSFGG